MALREWQVMDVGSLIRYKHDHRKTGVIISINDKREQGDRYLVLWGENRDIRGGRWYVHMDWIEEVPSEERYG